MKNKVANLKSRKHFVTRPATSASSSKTVNNIQIINIFSLIACFRFIYFQFSEHHVHFDQASLKDEFEADNCVTYQKAGDDCVVVHLGFLQVNHRYLIDLRLPHSLYKADDHEPVTLVPDHSGAPNIHCKVIASGNEFEATDSSPNEESKPETNNTTVHSDGAAGMITDKIDYHYLKVEYFAHKEKLLREELKLIHLKNSEELLKLVITARVLGKGKGTPMLRNGIHCIGYEGGDEESSETSDAPHTTCSASTSSSSH